MNLNAQGISLNLQGLPVCIQKALRNLMPKAGRNSSLHTWPTPALFDKMVSLPSTASTSRCWVYFWVYFCSWSLLKNMLLMLPILAFQGRNHKSTTVRSRKHCITKRAFHLVLMQWCKAIQFNGSLCTDLTGLWSSPAVSRITKAQLYCSMGMCALPRLIVGQMGGSCLKSSTKYSLINSLPQVCLVACAQHCSKGGYIAPVPGLAHKEWVCCASLPRSGASADMASRVLWSNTNKNSNKLNQDLAFLLATV